MNSIVGRAATPWHLWAVGIVSLLWNGFGAYDYVMSQLRNEAYMAAMTEPFGFSAAEAITYFDSFPVWADAAWAVGVWGAVLGSLLLILRNRFAFHAFAAALAGLVLTIIYQYANPLPGASNSPLAVVMTALVTAITIALIYYAKRMTRSGVLR